MSEEIKIYSYKPSIFIILIFIGICNFLIAVQIIFFSNPDNIKLLFGYIIIILSIMTIITAIDGGINSSIATTKNKIIFHGGSLHVLKEIDINKIEKIERKSATKIIIYYINKNNKVKKLRLNTLGLIGEDQIKFNNYIENLIRRKISPAV